MFAVDAKLLLAEAHPSAPRPSDSLLLNLTVKRTGTANEEASLADEVLLVVVADHSGSMSGPWERQVVPALKYIVMSAAESELVHTRIILFDTAVTSFQSNEEFISRIDSIRANGGTSFEAAFKEVNRVLNEEFRTKSCKASSVIVGFLTDGEDRPLSAHLEEELKETMKIIGVPVVVHCIGFSSGINLDLLDNFREKIGTHPGEFQYAEPGMEESELREKLELLIQVASSSHGSLVTTISMSDYEFTVDSLSNPRTEPSITHPLRFNKDSVAESSFVVVQKDNKRLVTGGSPVEIRVQMAGSAEVVSHVSIQPITGSCSSAMMTLKVLAARINQFSKTCNEVKSAHDLHPRAMDTLSDIFTALNHFKTPAAMRLLSREQRGLVLEQVQALSKRAQLVHKYVGDLATGTLQSISNRARLAEITYGTIFADARRGRLMNRVTLHNVTEMEAIEKAVAAHVVSSDAIKDASAESTDTFKCTLTQSAWSELLTIGEDIAGEGDGTGAAAASERDILGMCIAVGRPEYVIDDPLHVRIFNVGLTTVCKTAFEDAVKYSIDMNGHLDTHGGFTKTRPDQNTQMGVAFRGVGNEPINAWLPLYIHEEHWKLMRLQLKPIIGYVVTLNPLGFQEKQLDVLLHVLGTIVMRWDSAPSERDVTLLLQFLRTCAAVAQDPSLPLKKRMLTCVSQFLGDHKFVSSLVVMIACLLVLNEDDLRTVFPNEGDEDRFWRGVLSEAIRRGAFAVFTQNKEPQSRIDAFIDGLLEGIPGDGPVTEEVLLSHEFVKVEGDKVDQGSLSEGAEYLDGLRQAWFDAEAAQHLAEAELKEDKYSSLVRNALIPEYQLRAQLRAKARERRLSALEILADPARLKDYIDDTYTRYCKQERRRTKHDFKASHGHWPGSLISETGRSQWESYIDASLKAKADAEKERASPLKASGARESAVEEVKGLKADAKTQLEEEEGPSTKKRRTAAPEYNPEVVPTRALDQLQWLANRLNKRAHPGVHNLISLALFVKTWRTIQSRHGGFDGCLKALDDNYGVAPQDWIADIRAAFAKRESMPPSFATTLRMFNSLRGPEAVSAYGVWPRGEEGHKALVALIATVAHGVQMQVTVEYSKLVVLDADYVDPLKDPLKYLRYIRRKRAAKRLAEYKLIADRNEISLQASHALVTPDLQVFAGIVQSVFQGRRNAPEFPVLYSVFQSDTALRIPHVHEKLQVLVSGLYRELKIDGSEWVAPILDGGLKWDVGHTNGNRFERTHKEMYRTVTLQSHVDHP
mmetsp:Transcript_34845/g.56396  ORF Transcript_34845/g.56396 Transcript_34845/m.56396 type:complete len:1266 (+) Transcript_34845:242-4039(+)|eukprot:CAMPEP_0184662882 /NCGR_PEP_ID=MMETSP0308-20130426/45437_1 /TAXON_ID=38269 /ORGANISM="Gloeochaete witrockiana, Strain SAG 46.84" /LENGTH=1265 /DNA_ID=CAMNT_0027105211 /DNA_START=178 /DNA_END=3975 /DNA_ORIENTATION=+